MLKEIFHDSFENFEITRICMENHASVTGWQKLFSSYKCFQLLAAVAIATFEIYGSKFSGYIILICSLLTNFFKSELFSCLPKVDHVMRSCQQDYLMITKRIMVPSPCFWFGAEAGIVEMNELFRFSRIFSPSCWYFLTGEGNVGTGLRNGIWNVS